MTHAYSSWVTNLGTLIMWWKSLAISFSTIMFHGDLLFLHMCTSPAQVNLERRCSTRYEGDDDSRKLATRGRSSLVSSWWAVSLSWARHGQTVGACQLEVLQQGRRRSTENSYYFKGRSVNGLSSTFQKRKTTQKACPSWLLSDPLNYTALCDIASWPLLRLPLTAPLSLVSRRQLLRLRPWCSWRWLSLPSPTSLFRWMARFSRREAINRSSQQRRAIEWFFLHLKRIASRHSCWMHYHVCAVLYVP